MFHKIILAVDLADASTTPKGLRQALDLAAASEGELRLVNVQPQLPATFMEYAPPNFEAQQLARARADLAAIVAKIEAPKVRLSLKVTTGGVYHELLGEAAEWGADLVVVGSHRPVLSDYLLGSNAKTIVAHAKCSVLVVRE